MGLWTVVGLAIRLITVYSDPNKVAGGDAYFYHYGANLLVSGHGFINPYLYIPHNAHHAVQSAVVPAAVHLLGGHPLGPRAQDLPGRTGLVLHPGRGGHCGRRVHRVGRSAAAGSA